MRDTVVFIAWAHIICTGLHLIPCIGNRNTCSGSLYHAQIIQAVTEGNRLFKMK